MNLKFRKRGKVFIVDAHKCGFFERFSGLMFTRRENAKALLFKFKENSNPPLHSLFVFFEFVVIWLDEKNNVVDLRICKPWKFYINTEKDFSKIIEIPFNRKYERIINELVKFKK